MVGVTLGNNRRLLNGVGSGKTLVKLPRPPVVLFLFLGFRIEERYSQSELPLRTIIGRF
jgi:hypothetical protein